MSIPANFFLYIITFLALYTQVFLLISFLKNRGQIRKDGELKHAKILPSATVVVPCWNEEKTLRKTVGSLLALRYPKDKLKIMLVDDGSTDKTWSIMQEWKNNPNMLLFRKENGGKHTALNLGIEKATTDLVGCLDADSFVDPDALMRISTYFSDPSVMAVAPSVMVSNPKNIVELAQRVEYHLGVFVKKVLGMIGGIHVTPGPFSFYRREIFATLGGFRDAHKTEDMEIAYRMQANHLKFAHSHSAYVYTVSPNTIKKLFIQRLRWIYGFINNTIDYRRVMLKKKYGAFSLYTIPSGVIGLLTVLYLFSTIVYQVGLFLAHKISYWKTVGFHPALHAPSFDWFFVSTQSIIILNVMLYAVVAVTLYAGKRLIGKRPKFSFDIVYFLVIYSFIAPAWIVKACYNTVFRKSTSWR